MFSSFRQVCPVVFGSGTIGCLGEKISEINGQKVFLIFDTEIKSAVVDKVILELLEAREVFSYEQKRRFLNIDDVKSISKIADEFNPDLVLGIGGGNCMDTAKAVVHFMNKDSKLWLIPTAAGSGCEVTDMSCIKSNDENGWCMLTQAPDFVIVDAELAKTLPSGVTASLGFEVLLYAVEALASMNATPHSDLQALESIRIIQHNLFLAFVSGSNLEVREKLAFASTLSGLAVNNTGVHFGHKLVCYMCEKFSLPYGDACAYVLPVMMCYMTYMMPEKLKKLAEIWGVINPEVRTVEDLENFNVTSIIRLMKDVNVPPMQDMGISFEQFMECVHCVIKENNEFEDTAPMPVDADVMQNLLAESIAFTYRWVSFRGNHERH